jgi:hypothetical protein
VYKKVVQKLQVLNSHRLKTTKNAGLLIKSVFLWGLMRCLAGLSRRFNKFGALNRADAIPTAAAKDLPQDGVASFTEKGKGSNYGSKSGKKQLTAGHPRA